MGSGMAWDCSMGVLCDFGGNDHYVATGGLTQGSGAQAGLGILFDYGGDDVYEGYGQGYASRASPTTTCPSAAATSASWSTTAARNKYGCGAENNVTSSAATSGGFLIDRPKRS